MKDKKELGELFENNSDCYADTWDVFPDGFVEGPVVMAMTKEKFIEVVSKMKDSKKIVFKKEDISKSRTMN